MLALALLPLLPLIVALPSQQPFSTNQRINPLKHLSAISPFYIPTEKPTPLPDQCELDRVSLLIRHSSIMGNDDEYEETMKPFIEKIVNMDKSKIPQSGEWKFLNDWRSPIGDDTLEVVSPQGKRDAKFLGKYIRDQYNSLFPPKKKTTTKKDKKRTPYKVWTASSTRDIDTAKSYIKGGFPSHQSGHDGEGDGEVVQLIQVPNKAKDWDRSLTPHKACDTFDKKPSLEPANKWLAVYAPKVIDRLKAIVPEFAEELVDQDILAMQMLCGYESIAVGSSHFCQAFTDEEWLDVEYYFDVRFHYMMGYGSHLSPYLGMPWVKTAKHLLSGKDTDGSDGDKDHKPSDDGTLGTFKKGPKLPEPKLPPNATHTQLLHPSFTHRESPAFVAVFLNLFNSSSHAHPSSEAPPLDHRVDDRAWRTSHLVSFLGHVALERYHCKGKKHGDDGDYVRAVVNGRAEKMSGCEDGLEQGCKWETFDKWVDERAERWGDWESVCEK
ncbi:uncharacterized protein I303_107251 [Kwoniella dejecticola CBS 10117]|uniref:Acid phosphatase n=1 Tax=Kwoniella dejecticola CBS 10117 TaxID=1296121 RepID=A0A1A5ZZ63_9TREE|nr:uncharacterized protein I303_06653 [Kwoniella dejecticola CBS 10117]OBR83094.1 hypothetical protein I303_06653 [Kwoniella dejecticola CBS 10117]